MVLLKEIYVITNLINGKQYIGQTSVWYKKRFNRHCRSYKYGVRTLICCAIEEFGKDNFTVSLIREVPDKDADFWEMFYIYCYKTHISKGGYNVTYGGKSNPMDIEYARNKHNDACHSDSFIERQRANGFNQITSDEKRKKCREATLNNLDVCIAGFRKYNDSRKIKVGMLDDNGNTIMTFDSLSDACRYLGVKNKSYTASIKKYADKYNKNGKRSKFLGYSWTLL